MGVLSFVLLVVYGLLMWLSLWALSEAKSKAMVPAIVAFVLGAFILIPSMLWAGPTYNVWQQGLVGEAALKRAEQDRKITIEESAATKASASNLADAEVIRARGVAKANEIIADGLGGPNGYLRYLYINGLNTSFTNHLDKIIYVPTEAGLPILEAGRFRENRDEE